MKPDKYEGQLTMMCPTCGGTQFEIGDDVDESTSVVKCISCGRELTKGELIRENGENIDMHISETKDQIIEDAAKELRRSLKDACRGNKFIKFK